MANEIQVKHRSNKQQTTSKKRKNQHNRNKNKKTGNNSYLRTNPRPAVDDNRLKRAEENVDDLPKKDSSKITKQDRSKVIDQNNGKPSKKRNSKITTQDNTKTTKQNNGKATTQDNAKTTKQNNGKAATQENGKTTDQNNSKKTKSNAKTMNQNSTNGTNQSSDEAKNQNTGNEKSQKASASQASSENQEVKHKEQSGKFETAFNRIHKALKEMVKGTDSDAFVELLYSGYKNHSLVRKYKSELHQFAKLRNAIVHERVNADYYIAEPHIEVVERIEEIAKEFEKPQTALSIATSPVFYYYEDAYLKDVLKVINKFDFTRFPVYDKDDKYVALLTSTEIIQWMAKHFSDSVVHFEDVRVKELLTKGKNYFVTFVDEEASLYHIEELFERYHTRGKKLQAVIITETGDRHGKPIGVITPWDLLDSDPED
ncbi:CBS domain-containing protein [Mesobacillus sp. AQ2]|uniref:CBS domain-containing protein n=1 Tax=Bacillaceae TaxID=186817 RepID=UPI0021B577EC|nr:MULTISPECIES: CBS domain-containing protein [Bacillaceae]WHX41458.1 CBS domain-containing protein [Mesobacillus sp. AQ2]